MIIGDDRFCSRSVPQWVNEEVQRPWQVAWRSLWMRLATLALLGSSTSSQPVQASVPTLEFASVEQGQQLLQVEDEFVRRMSPFDRSGRLRMAREVSQEEYQQAVVKHVLEWQSPQRARVQHAWDAVIARLSPLQLPLPEKIVCVQTNGEEEGNAAYTRGNAIVLPTNKLSIDDDALQRIMAHELFHILSRYNPILRSRLYATIGFQPCPEPTIADNLKARLITNPDAPYYDHCIRVTKDGRDLWVLPVLLSKATLYDAQLGERFFDYMQFRLLGVPNPEKPSAAESPDVGSLFEWRELGQFAEQIGQNTNYIIHPEEILADHFAIHLTHPETAKSPQLLHAMVRVLQQLDTNSNRATLPAVPGDGRADAAAADTSSAAPSPSTAKADSDVDAEENVTAWIAQPTCFTGKSAEEIRVANATLQTHDRSQYSISSWVNIDPAAMPRGDMVSQYDRHKRQGMAFGFLNNLASTSGAGNSSHVMFYVDRDLHDATWTDLGRPGAAVLIFSLCAHQGQLFASTCEPGANQVGKVYRHHPDQGWIDCGCPNQANAVTSLSLYRGQLYAANGKYRLRGSALPDSPNTVPGGEVFRYVQDGRWEPCGRIPGSEAVNGMVEFRDRLYVSSLYSPGCYRYEPQEPGGAAWVSVGTPEGRRVEALTVYQDALWGGSYDAGEIYRYTPEQGWKIVGQLPETTQTYGFAVYGGELYVGTWPQGKVYRFVQDGEWVSCGRLAEEKEVMAMVAYGGQLLAGTLPSAQVFRFESDNHWTNLGQLDATPDVTYRRVWSMAVHDGKLVAGTLPSGHIKSWQAGRMCMSSQPLAQGWHLLVGVRDTDEIRLYIDGALQSTQALPPSLQLETSGVGPLRIGNGPHEPLDACIQEVRIHSHALSVEEIKQLVLTRNE